jgi:arylsulfatase
MVKLSSTRSTRKENKKSDERIVTREKVLCIILPLILIVVGSLRYGHQVDTSSLLTAREWYNQVQQQVFESLNETIGALPAATSSRDNESVPKPTSTRREKEKEQPMNIVIFYADDWTMNVLGKLNPRVITPHIDHMADNGVLFTNNCVTTSMCWISRASFFTGLYAAVHGESEPSSNKMFEARPWNQTLFPLLKNAGYYTGMVGKWHAPQPPEYMSMTFDWSNFYFGAHWEQRDGKLRHVTDLNREDAMYFLKNRPKDQLFALKVSFFATHAWDGRYPSYQPMNESKARLYTSNETIPRPKTATEQAWKDLPSFFTERNEGRHRWRRRWEPDYYQDNIRDLYRMATEVDAVVGIIIKELKRQGVYNNTLLIFTTDNGNMHGEHGLAEKVSCAVEML